MVVGRSTNSGATWERDTLGTTQSCCYALAIDRLSRSNIVYAGGEPGVFKSTDAGSTWTLSSTGLTGTVYDIAVNPVNSSIVYAASSAGVFKSTNGSANWTSTGLSNVVDVLVVPGTPDTVYAGTSSGVYKSMTGGGNWTAMNSGLSDLNVTALGINPIQHYLFASTRYQGMYSWNLTVAAEESNRQRERAMFTVKPNPAVSRATILYALAHNSTVCLSVYDTQGRLVQRLVDHQSKNAGVYQINWDCTDQEGSHLATGIYFLKLETNDDISIQKLMIAR